MQLRRVRELAGPHCKWIALSNTTSGVLMASINASILLIALPDIFRGVDINPLAPGNTSLLLWLIMGYMVVTAVLVVSFGRLGDMYGRVKMYNAGFAVFTVFSILLAVTWMQGVPAVYWLIIMRIFQGVGGAMLMANSNAIITDAFSVEQRGLALGLNQVAGIAGAFLGLIIGGLLGPIDWRLVFLVSVPVGVFGTVWAYLKLHDNGIRQVGRLDWWGNVTFAVGLISLLVGITYGIQPYGHHTMGWTNPGVLGAMVGGAVVLGIFVAVEKRSADPMFELSLFRIRAFTAGNLASLLSGIGRGGLMFVLIIWLQGIWLPQHGFSFAQTPLWAGIYMLPLTIGFLVAGPVSGAISDRHGARLLATGGMVVAALSFVWLLLLPVNFQFWNFAMALLVNGVGMGLFAAPNRAGIMNALPPNRRGVGAGMSTTFQNSAMVLSIGIFFSLMINGLPPVSVLFASLLGYNPVQTLLGPAALAHLPASDAEYLTGRAFFPALISGPFADGLAVAFGFPIVACFVAAVASALRGGKYAYGDGDSLEVVGSVHSRAATRGAGDVQGVGTGRGVVAASAPDAGAQAVHASAQHRGRKHHRHILHWSSKSSG